jgi:hypothetical protein
MILLYVKYHMTCHLTINNILLQIIMDNGPARKLKTAQTMQEAGDRTGDPFEISTIRRDVCTSCIHKQKQIITIVTVFILLKLLISMHSL